MFSSLNIEGVIIELVTIIDTAWTLGTEHNENTQSNLGE
jgi:hypothetical protein